MLCGLAAGLLLIALPRQAGIDLMPAFMKLWSASDGQQMLAKAIWYAIPAAAIVGGLLAFLVPGIAALLMLAAGVGWAGIEVSLPNQFHYLSMIPAVLCGLGVIFAYAAGEIRARQRRDERRRRRELELAPTRRLTDPDILARDDVRSREAALRMDPLTMERRPVGNPSAPMSAASPRPKRDIPLTLEDAATRHRDEPMSAPTVAPAVVAAHSAAQPSISASPDQSDFVHPAVQRGRAEALERRVTREPERRGGLLVWLAVVNAIVLAALGVGVFYLLLERGDPASPVTQAVASAVPDTTSTIAPVSIDAPVSVVPAGFTDPFAYCAAVGTIDYVDGRYTGPVLVPEIAEALHIPATSARDRVRWRCASGTVMACTSYGWPICDTTPDATEMLAFCQRNPEVSRLLAPNGTWACKAGRPVIPDDASWPVDDRGFLPKAWQAVMKSGGTTPAGG